MLTPIQLVRGAIAVMERVPDAAFGLSDLVANLCQRDDGKLRNQILEQILINLRGDQSIEVRTSKIADDGDILAIHSLWPTRHVRMLLFCNLRNGWGCGMSLLERHLLA